ncbi:signal peptidase II [Allorhizobium taibaishanense]|uniref:Lipoprotein signal peptidase n=1 Tax=Allorhizobium taibaishanense TaxID=887144 RepID=A0A1Q9A8P1_9HYPH|nr:signal peptidase II [Allorhizobium taibaishanense]MBB4009496.1 signal peptidase II [Allorhizobium taibaishanense]OLP50964.1 signal peptidase II [Allorhizobium taibaishanense]
MPSAALFCRPVPAILFILSLLLLDQAIKYAVEVTLPMQELISVAPMLGLYRTHNLGVAFSMLSHLDAWMIVAMRLAIVVFVTWLWRNTSRDHHFAHLGYCLIIAGAFGNIIDRFTYGYVVDYILFHTETWSFAVFNLADSLISVGAGFILLEELLLLRRPKV